jgi:hypothetical protein
VVERLEPDLRRSRHRSPIGQRSRSKDRATQRTRREWKRLDPAFSLSANSPKHNILCGCGKGWEAQERQGLSPKALDWRWPVLRLAVLCLPCVSEALDCAD